MKRLAVFLTLTLVSTAALAGDPTASLGLGGRLMTKFVEILSMVESAIRPAALSLFVTLMLIDTGVWSWKQMTTGDTPDVGAIALKITWNIGIYGFFAWLILQSHYILTSIIQSFFKLGQTATGLGALDAVQILSLGTQAALSLFSAGDIGWTSILDKPLITLTAVIAVVLLVIAFAIAATQLVMAQVEAMFVISCAPILFSFGALSFTRDIAAKALSHSLATGVKIFVIYILAGVYAKMGPEIAAVLKENSDQIFASPGQMVEIIGISAMMILLSLFIPTLSNAMLSGQASLSGNSAITSTLGIAAGTAAVAAAGVGAAHQAGAAAMGGMGGAAAGAAGLSKALSAGLSSASDHGLSGLGAAAHAVGQVAGQGMSMAAGGIGEAVAGGGKSFSEKVAQSTGGKIAANIEAGRGGAMTGAQSTGSGQGSSAGQATPSTSSSSASSPGNSQAAVSSSSAPASAAAPASTAAASQGGGADPSVPATSAASNLTGFVPSDFPQAGGLGDASTAAISGGGTDGSQNRPASKLGRLAAATADALGVTHEALNRTKEHVIEDRAQVGVHIDTKGGHT